MYGCLIHFCFFDQLGPQGAPGDVGIKLHLLNN